MERVLIYAMSENMGGIEEYVLNLSRYKSDSLCQYEYIVLGDGTPYQKEMERLGVEYHFIPKKKSVLNNIFALNRLFRTTRKKTGVVYFNTSVLVYPIPYILAVLYKYKVVLHSHLTGTDGIRRLIHIFNRIWINRIVSERLACSTPAGKWMFGKTPEKPFTVIPNAIQLSRFCFDPVNRQQIRSQLQIKDEFVIGHVGRLAYVKNQHFLIGIVSKAKKYNLNCKLLLVGDGEDLEQLKEYAEIRCVKDSVIFYGKSNSPEKMMSAMDCFVMPSIVEGFPITLVEAQASGLPCLVSDAITKEVNITGNVFFKSLNDNLDSWYEEILRLPPRYDAMELLSSKGYDVNDLEKRVRSFLINGECKVE